MLTIDRTGRSYLAEKGQLPQSGGEVDKPKAKSTIGAQEDFDR